MEELLEEEAAGWQAQSRANPFGALLPKSLTQAAVGVLALMFLAGAMGYAIGLQGDDGAPSADSADVGFLYDMTAHHEQAVRLSLIELTNGSDPSVQAFAREIVMTQSYEIGLMKMRLGTWGFDTADRPRSPMAWMGMALDSSDAMPGMADAAELEAFRSAEGEEADALFIALMSDHHLGGVAMAEAAADSAEHPWVRDTADSMARIQASEIAEMEFARNAAGLTANPQGFASDFDLDGSHDTMMMEDMLMNDEDSEMTPTSEGG